MFDRDLGPAQAFTEAVFQHKEDKNGFLTSLFTKDKVNRRGDLRFILQSIRQRPSTPVFSKT